ncbi:LIM-domain binding protein-domain-containing protein [Pyronema domesticum]|nr:LIM-domain binding protein-domain-containing protein [Pyronema domesticum]
MMATTYSQHNPMQQHPVQQVPQQHIQHPGQSPAIVMQQQHMHPQQQQQHYQQLAALAAQQGRDPGSIQAMQQVQQAQLIAARQRAMMANGMAGNPAAMAQFQAANGGGPQIRAGGMPNGVYPGGGPGGVPGGPMGQAFAAANPQMRFPANIQQLQQQQQQQQQIAAAQQYTAMSQAAAQGNAQAAAMNMPQQGQPMPMGQLHPNHPGAVSQAALAQMRQAAALHAYSPSSTNNDMNHWRKFVGEFYSPIGVMRQGLIHKQNNEMKQFEITTNLLARYYFTLFESGIRMVQMLIEQPREKPTVNQGTIVDCPKTSFIYWFENDCHVVAQGQLRVHLNQHQQIDMLDFTTHNHTEYVTRDSMKNMFERTEANHIKSSPGSSLGKRPQRSPPPELSPVTSQFGLPPLVLSLLENAETLSQMKDLITFSQQNPHLGPTQALTQLVNNQMMHQQALQQQQSMAQQHQQAQQQQAQAQHLQQQAQAQQQAQQQHAQQQQQQHAQGMPNGPMARAGMPGGPGVGGMPPQLGISMANSPSVTGDIRMGGVQSPHIVGGGATPSPAQNHMQAPGMIAQHSQHQHPTSNPSSNTSTTVGSANTSPNQTNKRRRVSTINNVKNDADLDGAGDGIGAINGGAAAAAAAAQHNKKQSPRGGVKRTKLQ